jgi:hypothetical protein
MDSDPLVRGTDLRIRQKNHGSATLTVSNIMLTARALLHSIWTQFCDRGRVKANIKRYPSLNLNSYEKT